ncbi:MAG: citrate synthase [Verrucomicrobiota bacterium]|nr:citrate synthase [Verrucomicrobiota bacterium]
MEDTGTIRLGNENFEFPIIEGTLGEKAIDTRALRAKSGCIAFDEGYGNTGSCLSKITFINGEKGILKHRGYSIEDLAKNSTFLETAMLIIYGDLPNQESLDTFLQKIRSHASIHTSMNGHYDSFPSAAHPMAILSSLLNSLGAYHPEMSTNNRDEDLAHFDETAVLLISKVRAIAAMTYRMKMGMPFIPPADISYTSNFLHMMFSEPYNEYVDNHGVGKALDLFLMLHADHEQNCSTSTVRMVASGGANLFASVSAGVSALWGPSHGGANMAVIKMLEEIHASGDDGSKFIEAAKKGEAKLMGFGHRVYKNYDPRAKILGKSSESILRSMGMNDPLLDIARKLEQTALKDDYFISRKLYPNVDFYSGIILKAIGIPVDMFTVMFALGRMPGWIANWKEIAENPKSRIHRPRQIYTGETERRYVPVSKR